MGPQAQLRASVVATLISKMGSLFEANRTVASASLFIPSLVGFTPTYENGLANLVGLDGLYVSLIRARILGIPKESG
jgi:hypothetical protein